MIAMPSPILQSEAATCRKGFVMCFLKVPLACLGSMTAAVQPYSLWNSQTHITKPVLQVADPECSCLHEQAMAFQHFQSTSNHLRLDGSVTFYLSPTLLCQLCYLPSNKDRMTKKENRHDMETNNKPRCIRAIARSVARRK